MFIFGRACGTFLLYSLYLHRLFQKAYGTYVLRYAVAAKKLILNVSKLPRRAVGLYRSEICVMHKSRRQNAQGWAGNKSETSFGTKLVLYRCTWTYIGREVHGRTLLNSPLPLNLTGKSGTDAASSIQQRCLRLRLKLVDEKCTRMYIFHQGRQATRKPRKTKL